MKEILLICPACRQRSDPGQTTGIVICPGCRIPIDLGQKCPKCGDEMPLRNWDGKERYICRCCSHEIYPHELYE